MQNEKAIPITNEMLRKLYSKRVVFLVEQNDGNFYQILMTQEQFNVVVQKMMMTFPHTINEKTGVAQAELSLGKRFDGKLFDNLNNTV